MSVAQRANQAFDTRATQRVRGNTQPIPRAREYTQPLPRVAEQTRTRRQPLALQRVLLFLCAILAAGACMGLLFLKSQVLVTQRSINKIQTEITQLERSNSEMSAQVTSAQNINVIMDRARQLGMNTPKQDQVLYVTLGDAERTSISAKQ